MRKITKQGLKMLLLVGAMVMLFAMPASAATKTSVKILKAGESYTIKNTSKVKSSKTSVVTAKKKSSTKYKITGKKKGASTLSVYNKNGKLSEKVYLLVYNSKTFKYNTDTVNLAKGKTKTVTASTNKSGVTIKYASSDKNIATVSSSGKISAKKAGKATISAKFYYKGTKVKTKKKTVNVYTSSYNTDSITLTVGKTKTVSASVSSNCSVKYSSSDISVATVSSKGKITAKKKGTATITCKVYVGNTKVKKYTKEVTVKAASSGSTTNSSSTSTSSFKNHVDTSGSTTIAGGKSFVLTAYCGSSSDKVTIDIENDCVKVKTSTGTCADDYNSNVTAYYTQYKVVGKVKGSCTLKVKINGTTVKTVTATVTSTDSSSTDTIIDDTYPGYSDYTVFLVGAKKVYSGYTYCYYVRTKNPDPTSFQLSSSKSFNFLRGKWSDIDYINYDTSGYANRFSTVDGGYVINFSLSEGNTTYPFEIVEIGEKGTKKTVKSFNISVIDSDKAETEWIDSIISKYTNSSMDPFEKMRSISNNLLSTSGEHFTYPANMNGSLLNLTTETGPYFETKKWDSFKSPAVLAKIAERIGEYDYIHNCYGDYARGSAEWSACHYICQVGVDGTIKGYSACPYMTTGEISKISYIDFGSTANLTKIS